MPKLPMAAASRNFRPSVILQHPEHRPHFHAATVARRQMQRLRSNLPRSL